jgi:uncharacterized protein (TIGR01777 family)
MNVIVAGGSGYIGKALTQSLLGDEHDVVVLSRQPRSKASQARLAGWDDVAAEVDGADAVVNLAGVSIGGPRWTSRRKEAIRSSRVETTRTLAAAIEAAGTKPHVLVTASGIDYYGDSGEAVVDETSPAGSSFLAHVCSDWEAAGAGVPTRHVAVRTALVVGRGATANRLMALPFRLFAGGPLGSGRQWFPWVHIDDLVRIYRLAIDDGGLAGPVNAVAPHQLRQREAARDFGSVLHRPALLPAPAIALRLLLSEQADLLLHGQRVVPSKLRDFEFRYPALRPALENALRF